MADATTTYDINIRLGLKDEAAPKVKQVTDELKRTKTAADDAASSIKTAFAAVAAIAVGHKAYDALVGFNDQMQQIKTSMAGVMMMNFGEGWGDASRHAQDIVKSFQQFSLTAPVTTEEVAQMGQAISMSAFQGGASVKEFKTLSEMGSVAAKQFGVDSGTAQMQLREMLMGNVKNTQVFTQLLLGAGKTTMETFRGLNERGRIDFLLKLFRSPEMQEINKQFGKTFLGVTSTLKDNLQMFFGAVGKPLFEAITKELARWNEWIDKNRKDLDDFAKSFGSSLASAFTALSDVVRLLVDHKELFLGLGALFGSMALGNKMGSFIGGASTQKALGAFGPLMASAMPYAMRGLMGYTVGQAVGFGERGSELMGLGGALTAASGPIGVLAAAATAAAAALKVLADDAAGYAKRTEEHEAQRAKFAEMGTGDLNIRQTLNLYEEALAKGLVTKTGEIDVAKIHEAMVRRSGGALGYVKSLLHGDPINYELMSKLGAAPSGLFGGPKEGTVLDMSIARAQAILRGEDRSGDEEVQKALELAANLRIGQAYRDVGKAGLVGKEVLEYFGDFLKGIDIFAGGPAKHDVNITIQHIDVQADDPDRFVFGIVEIARQAVRAPGSSRFTPPDRG